MADVAFTSFDGTAVNGSTSIGVAIPKGDAASAEVSVSATSRRNAAGVFEAMAMEPLEFTLLVYARDRATAYATWKQTVEGLFQPWTSGAARQLVGTLLDGGSTEVFLDVVVMRRRKFKDEGDVRTVFYEVDVRADYPLWRKTTTSTSSGNPNNAGNTPAAATLELTTATHKQIRECSVSGAGAGGGMMGYPVRLAYTEASLTSGEVFAFVNGANTPTYSDNYSAYVWTLVDTSQDGNIATLIDLLTVDGIAASNLVGGRLEQGGLKLGDAVSGTDCSNTLWAWNDFQISQNPIRCGAWRPAVSGADRQGSFQLESESATSVAFSAISLNDNLRRDADSMALLIGAQGNSLSGLWRVTDGLDIGGGTETVRAYCRARSFGSATWFTVWSTIVDATHTSALSLANAVEVVVGVEVHTSAQWQHFASITLSGGGTGGVFTLSLNASPTVTVGAASTADYYNGTFTNSTTGESIEFKDVVVKDGTLYLDSLRRLVYSSVGAMEPIYGDVRFTEDDNWLLLEPGSNVVSNGISGSSYTLRWSDCWA